MSVYTQKGYLHYILSIVLVLILFLFIIPNSKEYTEYNDLRDFSFIFMVMHIFANFIILFCILSFYKMSLIIDDKMIILSLGVGWIKRKFEILEIKSCQVSYSGLTSGLGIRYIDGVWLYNVKFGKTVELSFKNKSNIVQFGFDCSD